MRRHVRLLHRAGAAGIRQVQIDSHHELPHSLNAAAGRNQIDRFAIEHGSLGRRRHVDDRRRARDRNGLFERADAELGVQRRGKLRRQLQAITAEGLEPGQCERDRVGARPQIRDAVAAVAVGDGGFDFLDQDIARRFDRHARHRSAGRVSHHAHDAALRVGGGRQKHGTRERQ
jgi:hypothetical protein